MPSKNKYFMSVFIFLKLRKPCYRPYYMINTRDNNQGQSMSNMESDLTLVLTVFIIWEGFSRLPDFFQFVSKSTSIPPMPKIYTHYIRELKTLKKKPPWDYSCSENSSTLGPNGWALEIFSFLIYPFTLFPSPSILTNSGLSASQS